VQRVVALAADCDGDAVLARVAPAGPACHTGAVSCFAQEGAPAAGDALAALDATIAARAAAPAPAGGGAAAQPSYTQRLLADRNLRLKKLGEEMAELVTAVRRRGPGARRRGRGRRGVPRARRPARRRRVARRRAARARGARRLDAAA
jgi:phosphoribosyl-ATP pyrophosphohydrolase/phosphoribosyl-AMP cyclohydrolase